MKGTNAAVKKYPVEKSPGVGSEVNVPNAQSDNYGAEVKFMFYVFKLYKEFTKAQCPMPIEKTYPVVSEKQSSFTLRANPRSSDVDIDEVEDFNHKKELTDFVTEHVQSQVKLEPEDYRSALGLRREEDFNAFFRKFNPLNVRIMWLQHFCKDRSYELLYFKPRARFDQQVWAVYFRVLWAKIEWDLSQGLEHQVDLLDLQEQQAQDGPDVHQLEQDQQRSIENANLLSTILQKCVENHSEYKKYAVAQQQSQLQMVQLTLKYTEYMDEVREQLLAAIEKHGQ